MTVSYLLLRLKKLWLVIQICRLPPVLLAIVGAQWVRLKKNVAQSYFYWPKLDGNVATVYALRDVCQKNVCVPPNNPIHKKKFLLCEFV